MCNKYGMEGYVGLNRGCKVKGTNRPQMKGIYRAKKNQGYILKLEVKAITKNRITLEVFPFS